MKAILTHPGSAHKDDFLACCLLVARYIVPVWRREPTDEDLANREIAVIDFLRRAIGSDSTRTREPFVNGSSQRSGLIPGDHSRPPSGSE